MHFFYILPEISSSRMARKKFFKKISFSGRKSIFAANLCSLFRTRIWRENNFLNDQLHIILKLRNLQIGNHVFIVNEIIFKINLEIRKFKNYSKNFQW